MSPHRFVVQPRAPAGTEVLTQVHGITVVEAIAGRTGPLPQADGHYLTQAGSIAVATADCLPVLISCEKPRLVMALHAGWRSLAGGIVQEAAKVWRHLGIAPEDLSVLMGPSICARHFEVGPEVVTAFKSPHLGLSASALARVISAGRDDRCHVDLSATARHMLHDLGVAASHISSVDSCTFCHPELWPSWRRDGKIDAHIWSVISW